MHLTIRALHLRCTLNPQLLYHLLLSLLVLLILLLLRLLWLPNKLLQLLRLTSASAETTLLRLPAALPGSSTSGSNSWTLLFRKGTSGLLMAHLAAVETTAWCPMLERSQRLWWNCLLLGCYCCKRPLALPLLLRLYWCGLDGCLISPLRGGMLNLQCSG